MGIIIWVIVGAALGLLANLVLSRDNTLGNVIAGVIGSVLAGWIATLFSIGTWNAFGWVNLLIAAAGACLLLGAGYKLLRKA